MSALSTIKLRPYPAYKGSGVPWLGRIPAGWEVRRNGRLFSERNQTDAAELPILEVSLKTGVRVRDVDSPARKQIMADRSKYKRAAKGDIAYNMMRMWQGAVGVAPVDGLVSPAYVAARPHSETDGRFYSYLFRTRAYMREVDFFSRGIVADRNRLYWDAFKQMPSAFPPRAEQADIADFLDAHGRGFARLVQTKRRLIELLNEQKRAIIQQAVTRGLSPNFRFKSSAVTSIGEIPEHWQVWRIGHLARVGNGSTPSRSKPQYWTESGFPWLNSATVHESQVVHSDQFVTDLALHECHLPRVQPGSLLVAITGQGKTRGTAAILRMEATINQHIAFIELRRPIVSPEFLHVYLVGAYKRLRAISQDSGSTKAALTCEDIKQFRIALPPVDEQRRIVAHVEEHVEQFESASARAEREIALLREYRTRLTADVVTGKLDVRGVTLSALDEPGDFVLDDASAFDDDPEEADDPASLDDAPLPETAEA